MGGRLARGPEETVQDSSLPLLNACLNSLAAVLLVYGRILIRRGRREAHARVMVAAFVVSSAFLASYLTYHFVVVPRIGHTPFRRTGLVKVLYTTLLVVHVLLAALNLPMVLATLWLAARGRIERHRRLARWTWPVWFVVSITGVLVYLALYPWNAPAP